MKQKLNILTLMAASLVLTACATATQKSTRASVDDDYSKPAASAKSEPAAVTGNGSVSTPSASVSETASAEKAVVSAPEPVVQKPEVKKPDPKPVVVKPIESAAPVAVVPASKPKNIEPVAKVPVAAPPKRAVTEPVSAVTQSSLPAKASFEVSKPVELAFADKALTAETSQDQRALTLRSLDDLPLSLSDGWLLQLSALPLTKDKVCVLHNVQENIFDGYETTSVEAWLTSQKVIVKSKSNFDLSYAGSGLTLHENGGVELDHFTLASTVSESVVDSEFPAKRYSRKQNLKLVVKTGFWPTWPVTETRTIDFVMNNYHSMLSTLQECATLLQSNQ